MDLNAALDRLDPDDRALLAMRYGAGFNATELARATGRKPDAVRQRLKRLLDRLREDLTDAFLRAAQATLERCRAAGVTIAVMMDSSPSCASALAISES